VVLHDFSLGGTERVAIRLANTWARAGREVRLICGAPHGPLRDLVSADVHVEMLNPAIGRAAGSRGRLAVAVAAHLTRKPCDLLFLPGNFHWPVIQGLARLPRDVRPRIAAQVSNLLKRPGRGRIEQAVFELTTRLRMQEVDLVVALSPEMQAEADRVLGRRVATVLPLPSLDDDSPEPHPLPPGPPLILAAGRLTPQKDFTVAVAAFARVRTPGARLVILGEGPERDAIHACARAFGVTDRIRLPGYVPDIRPWLDRSRLFLLSSKFEGYGGVAVEALAAGRPLVATRCGPLIDELVGPHTGSVSAPVGDAAAIATALDLALSAPPPNPLMLARQVDKHRIAGIADAYLRLFDEAVANGRHAPKSAFGP
jgi:glycosyltransferase involved in cell wall biosynthesis